MAVVRVRLFHLEILLYLFYAHFPSSVSTLSESGALLVLKESFGQPQALNSWKPGILPCKETAQWAGILCHNGAVTGLRLGNMGISGEIDANVLTNLTNLRSISIVNNNISGKFSDFSRLGALKALYLSQNNFSGEIPDNVFADMNSLKKLWLDGNNFSGKIPKSLLMLPRLVELRLENNNFSGKLPVLASSTLKSFNVSNNSLEGKIPWMLRRFDTSSFLGNEDLCGLPIGNECMNEYTIPMKSDLKETFRENDVNTTKRRFYIECAFIWISLFVIIFLIGIILTTALRSSKKKIDPSIKQENRREIAAVASIGGSVREERRTPIVTPELVMVNDAKGVFALSDLMKSAAEVLGNGRLGSSYKAVLGTGVTVVVKRTKEMIKIEKEEFVAEIQKLGRLHHANIITPLAYHYRRDEKLIVFEYVEGGSLMHLLHGDRVTNPKTINWPTRLKIVQGICRGMVYLHDVLATCDLPHGDLKSSNVLLGPDFEPLLTDYGFSTLVIPTQASQTLTAYNSPEFQQYGCVSHKSDVYSLGIVILEILTGKYPVLHSISGKIGIDLPQWIRSMISNSKENDCFDSEISGESDESLDRMKKLFKVGVACIEPNPELRPEIREVSRLVEEIAGEEDGSPAA